MILLENNATVLESLILSQHLRRFVSTFTALQTVPNCVVTEKQILENNVITDATTANFPTDADPTAWNQLAVTVLLILVRNATQELSVVIDQTLAD